MLGQFWDPLKNKSIRRAFAQGVSDHQHWIWVQCFQQSIQFLKQLFQQSIHFLKQQFRNFATISNPAHFFSENFEQCFNCCSNNCFLSEKCAREAASPGASRHWNRVAFDFGGSLFLKQFLERLFFTQNWDFWGKWLSKWTQNEGPRELFFRKSAKLKKCVWTPPAWTDCIWAHPVESSGRPKNRRKKGTYFRTPLFRQNM